MSQLPETAQPLDLVLCSECDAAVGAEARFCWLCGHQMDSPFKGRHGQIPVSMYPVAASPDATRETVLNVSLGVLVLVLILVTAAVWAQEPLFGIALAIVLVPALGITLLRGLFSRLSGRPLTASRRMLVFIKSTLVMIGVATVTAAVGVIIAVVVIIGAIIALFESCFKMLGGQ